MCMWHALYCTCNHDHEQLPAAAGTQGPPAPLSQWPVAGLQDDNAERGDAQHERDVAPHLPRVLAHPAQEPPRAGVPRVLRLSATCQASKPAIKLESNSPSCMQAMPPMPGTDNYWQPLSFADEHRRALVISEEAHR